MPRSLFYYIVENNPEKIGEVRAIIDADNREQHGLILMSKTKMLRKVIEVSLAIDTKVKVCLAIFMFRTDIKPTTLDKLPFIKFEFTKVLLFLNSE